MLGMERETDQSKGQYEAILGQNQCTENPRLHCPPQTVFLTILKIS